MLTTAAVSLPAWSQVRLVADRQRHVLWAFLAGLLLQGASLALYAAGGREQVELAGFAPVVILVVVRGVMAVTVFRLTAALGSSVAPLWAIGAFLPNLVGLVVLLVANGRATRFLGRAGVKVGFMGARLPDAPPPGYADVSDVFS